MRLITFFLPFLSVSLVASITFSNIGTDQAPLDNIFNVPGKNPLHYCADPKDYILTIDFVDLDPNPPKPGSTLEISASGTFSETIEPGAKVALTVKYGVITLIHQTADLCDQITNVDLECPLNGTMTMTHSADIPKQVPPGKYTVMADVVTVGGDQVTCLESVIYF